jgi:hypothetical protein
MTRERRVIACDIVVIECEALAERGLEIAALGRKRKGRPFLRGRPNRDLYFVLLEIATADRPSCDPKLPAEAPQWAMPQALWLRARSPVWELR